MLESVHLLHLGYDVVLEFLEGAEKPHNIDLCSLLKLKMPWSCSQCDVYNHEDFLTEILELEEHLLHLLQ